MEELQSQGGDRQKPLLHIPSHAQVLENSRPQPPPSFFRPSASAAQAAQAGGGGVSALEGQQGRGGGAAISFTEAFSFVRQTEFYSPPPPAPAAPAPSSGGDHGSGVGSRPQEYAFPRIYLFCYVGILFC